MSDYIYRDVINYVGGATLVSGTTTLMGPFNLSRYAVKTLTVYNLGPTTMSGAIVQVNPDFQGSPSGTVGSDGRSAAPAGPNAGLWETYNESTFTNLAVGGVRSLRITGDVHRWWRVQGVSDLQTVTASGYFYAATI